MKKLIRTLKLGKIGLLNLIKTLNPREDSSLNLHHLLQDRALVSSLEREVVHNETSSQTIKICHLHQFLVLRFYQIHKGNYYPRSLHMHQKRRKLH